MMTLYIKDRDFYHELNLTENYEVSFRVVSNAKSTDVLSKNNLPPHLRCSIIVIDSTNSGAKNSSKIYSGYIVPIFDIIGVKHEYWKTTDQNSILNFANQLKNFCGEDGCTVIIISGDTSVHELVNCLPKIERSTNINFGIIPSGSGNALALELYNCGKDEIVVSSLLKVFTDSAKLQGFPLLKASFPKGSKDVNNNTVESSIFFVVLSWGLHASIVADSDAPEFRKLGNERFKMAALNNIQHIEQSYEGTISEIENVPVHGYFLLAMVKSLEFGFMISPKSDLLNSISYFIDIPFKNNQAILDILYEVYDNAKHIKSKNVIYKKFSSNIQLTLCDRIENKRRICVDGKIIISNQGNIKITRIGNEYNGWALKLIV